MGVGKCKGHTTIWKPQRKL